MFGILLQLIEIMSTLYLTWRVNGALECHLVANCQCAVWGVCSGPNTMRQHHRNTEIPVVATGSPPQGLHTHTVVLMVVLHRGVNHIVLEIATPLNL